MRRRAWRGRGSWTSTLWSPAGAGAGLGEPFVGEAGDGADGPGDAGGPGGFGGFEVLEGMRAWQARPLEAVYPVVYVDALVAKVRDGGSVRNKAVNIAVGIDCDGIKHVLGIWIAAAEGARAWAQAFAQMRNRGLEDVIFCCCDGLGGLARRSPRPGRLPRCRPVRCT